MSHKTEIQGSEHWRDARGAWVPKSLIRPMDQLMDECVEKILGYAAELSAQIQRFRGHTFDDIGSLQALIAQEYNTNGSCDRLVGFAKAQISASLISGGFAHDSWGFFTDRFFSG